MNRIKPLLQYKTLYVVLGIIVGWVTMALFSGGFNPAGLASGMAGSGSSKDTGAAVAAIPSENTIWTCSMHPQIRQPEAGPCPICGMDLIPVSSGEEEDSGPRELKMSEAAKGLAEIQTVAVRRDFAEYELRMVGKVEYDETRLKYITAWFPGRLDRLYVDYTGTPVREGDHLAEIYSPTILTDQEALIQAKKAVDNLSESSVESVLNSRIETLERARERLRLLGLTRDQIQQIEERGVPFEQITFYSPIDGVVIHKNALIGDYVQTGTRIYTIADLQVVWVKLDAYESDLPWIHYGQEVEFTTVAHPGEVFKGRVSFIDPYLNEQTRTVKVRVNVENRDGKLKPEMFVRAVAKSKVNAAGTLYDTELAGKWISPMHPEIIKDEPGVCDICGMPLVRSEELGFVDPHESESAPPLLIPVSALLITGKRAVVYVQIPDAEKPTFEGREVVLGARLKDDYIVESGLEEGEEVVVKGNFKLDSALQIMAKPSMMSAEGGLSGMAGSMSSKGAAASQAAEGSVKSEPVSMPEIPKEALADFLGAYQRLHKTLAEDDLSGAQQATEQWVQAAKEHRLPEIESLGHHILHATEIGHAREAFYRISEAMIYAIKQQGSPDQQLFVVHCPMAFENTGADWLQSEEGVLNPYFGATMLTCGYVTQTLSAHASR